MQLACLLESQGEGSWFERKKLKKHISQTINSLNKEGERWKAKCKLKKELKEALLKKWIKVEKGSYRKVEMKEGKYATKLKRNRLLKNNNHIEIYIEWKWRVMPITTILNESEEWCHLEIPVWLERYNHRDVKFIAWLSSCCKVL